MKLIRIKKSPQEHIVTPWLTTAEAAEFLGLSRKTFRVLQQNILPCPAAGGDVHNKRYYSPVLTQWWMDIHRLSHQHTLEA